MSIKSGIINLQGKLENIKKRYRRVEFILKYMGISLTKSSKIHSMAAEFEPKVN